MKFLANSLSEIYAILEQLPKPIAVFDFLCGEWGYEVLCSQSVAHKFYNAHKGEASVVALCWHGSPILYSNISEHQIEFADDVITMLGNDTHMGEPRYEWLMEQEHKKTVDAIPGVVVHEGPMYWEGGAPWAHRLRPLEYRTYLDPFFATNFFGILSYVNEYYTRAKPVFHPPAIDLPQSPYIALFDRNEKHQPERNVKEFQIDLLLGWARKYDYRLVVISGLYPRAIADDVIQFTPACRDMDLLGAVAQGAALFAGPSSGASEAAMVMGCHFVLLRYIPPHPYVENYRNIVESRGYRYFGELDVPNSPVIAELEEYLCRTR